MTALALGSSSATSHASMAVPQTQNTAPVLEFRCLFTKDLRQKHKRWQDGRLKYHTFNKRVMVYDERANFVGDTHWQRDEEFDEGKELELDRSGVLIEVGECIGKKDQDLTELVDKRVKEKEGRLAARTATASPARSAFLSRSQLIATPAGSHLQPRSLNAVIGIPTGNYGRAVLPTTTPFEERQRLLVGRAEGNENERPAKRRKQDISPPSKRGYARNLFGAPMTLSRPPSSAISQYSSAKPSIQISHPGSIDSSKEPEGDGKKPQAPRQGINEERSFIQGSAKSRVQKRRPASPPPRSSYASNLTGVPLSLSAPRELQSSRAKKVSKFPIGTNESRMGSGRASSPSNSEDDPVEIAARKKQPAAVAAKYRNPSRTREENSVSSTNSSSPPPAAGRTSISRSSSTTGTNLTSKSRMQQSTLRIKAREPKRMMMLMERPESRASPYHSGFRCNTAAPTTQERVPSQAAARSHSMPQKSEERLKARLVGNGQMTNIDKLPSSPIEDSGIDHETIDALLSRERTGNSRGSAKGPPIDASLQQAKSPTSVAMMSDRRGSKTSSQGIIDAKPGASYSGATLRLPAVTPVNEPSPDEHELARSILDASVVQKSVLYSTLRGSDKKSVPTTKDIDSQTTTQNHGESPNTGHEIQMLATAQVEEAQSALAILTRENEIARMKAIEEGKKLEKIKEEMETMRKRAMEERQELERLAQDRLERLEDERLERVEAEKKRLDREGMERKRQEKERLEIERLEKEVAAARQQKVEEERQAEQKQQEMARVEQERMRKEAVRQEQERTEHAHHLREAEEESIGEPRMTMAPEELQRSKENTDAQDLGRSVPVKLARAQKAQRTVNTSTANTARSRPDPAFPAHLENAISSATDRFRKMINAPQLYSGAIDQPDAGIDAFFSSNPPKPEPLSGGLGITRSGELPVKDSNEGGSVTDGMSAIPELPNCAIAAMTSGVTKAFKLSRPVTRMDTASNISESLNPAAMPPPRRNGAFAEGNSETKGSARSSLPRAADHGPWSREAFDLFPWRPPP